MRMTTSRILLTYDTMHHAVTTCELPEELINLPWYAVARGALPFATMLSVKYDRQFGIIDPKQGFIMPLHEVVDSDGDIVIIDDVVGSGKTMRRVAEILNRAQHRGKMLRLLLVKTPGDDADAFVLDGTDTYYDFPWEPNGV